MTLNDLLLTSYAWADQNAVLVLYASALLPMAGTALAWIGRGGKTDADGRFIASVLMGAAMLSVALEILAVFVARTALGARLMDANALLLAAPVVCLVGSIVGVRAVFPLSELGSVRAAADIGAFLVAAGLAVFFLSKFRGWGIMFLGGFMQLVIVTAIAGFFLYRLYRRAFGFERRDQPDAPPARTSGPSSTLASVGLSLAVVALSAAALVAFARFMRPASSTASTTSPFDTASAGSRAGSGFYSFIDEQGTQHVVGSRAEVPERYRAAAQPIP